jgi:divalent metal cation (Fe/Co/Zn/Cd) transporter
VGAKAIAFLLCRTSSFAVVRTLALDHRNDVISNSVGLIGLALALRVNPLADPCVALITTFFIMYVWGRSAYEQAIALSGAAAPPELINSVTALALNCDPRLVAVDTVRAVTSGSGYVVEVDLVLPPDMPLRDAHDIGERFQLLLEKSSLEIVRCYVHLDYETEHDPREHR